MISKHQVSLALPIDFVYFLMAKEVKRIINPLKYICVLITTKKVARDTDEES